MDVGLRTSLLSKFTGSLALPSCDDRTGTFARAMEGYVFMEPFLALSKARQVDAHWHSSRNPKTTSTNFRSLQPISYTVPAPHTATVIPSKCLGQVSATHVAQAANMSQPTIDFHFYIHDGQRSRFKGVYSRCDEYTDHSLQVPSLATLGPFAVPKVPICLNAQAQHPFWAERRSGTSSRSLAAGGESSQTKTVPRHTTGSSHADHIRTQTCHWTYPGIRPVHP